MMPNRVLFHVARSRTRDRRRTGLICACCGVTFTARPGDHLAAIYCPTCLEDPDDPVTAEHYWDIGGSG